MQSRMVAIADGCHRGAMRNLESDLHEVMI
jgi:hypothetical protein